MSTCTFPFACYHGEVDTMTDPEGSKKLFAESQVETLIQDAAFFGSTSLSPRHNRSPLPYSAIESLEGAIWCFDLHIKLSNLKRAESSSPSL